MPIILAIIYPTYTHMVYPEYFEWTRLHELPFVFFEFLVILFALAKGFELSGSWIKLPRDVKAATLLLLVGAFIGSVFFSKHGVVSVAASCIIVIHLIFSAALYHLLVREEERDLSSIMTAFAVSLAILTVYTAWWFATAPDPSTVPGGEIRWDNAIPGFISVRHFGAWSGAITAGFAISILCGRDSKNWNWNHLLYTSCAAVTVWTGTRAAVLAIIFVVLVSLLTLRKLPTWKAIGRAAVLTGVALTLAWLFLLEYPAFQLIVLSEYGDIGKATGGRSELWSQTFHRWLASPWFGWGTDSTFWETYIGWNHTQPHNVILQFLISWGVVGASGGLYLIGRAIRQVHTVGFTNESLRPLTAVLYGFLFQSLLEGMLYYPRFIGAIIFLFVLVMTHRSELRTSK